VEAAVYRIVQESITNVVRHADATRVDVDVHETEDGMISVSIVDDGRRTPGAPSAETADGGNGIAGMRERAHLLGGTFSAERQDPGFAVRASIPLEVVEK
jgi:signal transduction histidine kinase